MVSRAMFFANRRFNNLAARLRVHFDMEQMLAGGNRTQQVAVALYQPVATTAADGVMAARLPVIPNYDILSVLGRGGMGVRHLVLWHLRAAGTAPGGKTLSTVLTPPSHQSVAARVSDNCKE